MSITSFPSSQKSFSCHLCKAPISLATVFLSICLGRIMSVTNFLFNQNNVIRLFSLLFSFNVTMPGVLSHLQQFCLDFTLCTICLSIIMSTTNFLSCHMSLCSSMSLFCQVCTEALHISAAAVEKLTRDQQVTLVIADEY